MSSFKLGSQPISNTMNGSYPQASTYLDYIQNKKGKRLDEQRQLFDTADEKMKRIHDIVWQISGTHVPVLITGEAGSGKKTLGRAIHEASNPDGNKKYFEIDCTSLSTQDLERELFGFETVSPNGESIHQAGKFEIASNGTLVLNEIVNTDLSVQAKLFKLLQEQLLELPGLKAPITINTRVIATTSKDIVKAVASGKFRQDLYYRLYVLHLEVPPLRERSKDIPLFAAKFIEQYAEQTHRPKLTLSESALSKLKKYSWPGNIREFEEVIKQAVLSCSSDWVELENLLISGEELPLSLEWVASLPIGQALHVVETHFILKTLAYHKGNRTHAAKTLGISLRTLRNKINEFTAAGFDVPAPVLGKLTS